VEPVEVVRTTWDAWQARDMDAVVATLAPDVVHDLSHFEGWPGEPVHAGVGPALHSLGEWMAWWQSYRQDLVGFETDGDRVLVVARHVGTRGGERFEEDLGLLFHVSGDLVTQWEPWSDIEAARAALRGS
jgi:ketosteroid isomerase-like protein